MRFLSFNINGLRAHFHQLELIIKKLNPDVIGLQETKISDYMFPIEKISCYGYNVYFYGQKQNYGVAILSKMKPISVKRNIENNKELQCRTILANFLTKQGLLTVINAYFPNGENRNHTIKFLAKKNFYKNLSSYIKNNFYVNSLLILMGDMNICPEEIDIGIDIENRIRWINNGKCAFLPEERKWILDVLSLGLIDTYRYINPETDNRYSWFDYRSRSFLYNRGLRIDLILASNHLIQYVKNSDIDYEIRSMQKPSDHAPTWTDFMI